MGVMDLLVGSLAVLVSKVVVDRGLVMMGALAVDRVLDSRIQMMVQVRAVMGVHLVVRDLVKMAPMVVQVQTATEVHLETRAQEMVTVGPRLAALVLVLVQMTDLTRAQMAMARTLTLETTLRPLIKGKALA